MSDEQQHAGQPADEFDNPEQRFSTSVTDSSVDVGAYQVGIVYARALLDAAEPLGQADPVVADLDTLIDEIVDRHPKLTQFLSSEMISLEVRRRAFERILENRFSPLFVNFCRVLIDHRRARCLRAVRYAAHELLDQIRGRVRVHVTSAARLDHESLELLTARLRSVLGAEPVLERRVDPRLIGGVVFRVGDTVYDGSVSARLERMRAQMINRSVHEIQSRRDRFSSAAGN
jgi:F-type H+-transporting ATPase subunit delta